MTEAASLYERILAADPNHAEALRLLGTIRSGHPDTSSEGIALIRRAIAQRPNVAAYHESLGVALSAAGDFSAAIAANQEALKLDAKQPETWFNLGNALRAIDRFDDAVAAYDRALMLRPNFLPATNNRAMALHEADRLDESLAAFDAATKIHRESGELWKNFGNALRDRGAAIMAHSAYRRAAAFSGDPRAEGNALYALHYLPGTTIKRVVEEHRAWDEKFAKPIRSTVVTHLNDRSPDRRLRIGYVSPDFTGHPVGRFLLPLLARHDHRNFEIVCYSDVTRHDPITGQIRSAADIWRQTRHLNDGQLAQLIGQDEIDILIDLTMHTKGNRLLTFARKPAPVQASYLAYVGTTGLETIGYRFTDAFLDPPGQNYPWVEQPVRLQSFWCYRPPSNAGDVAPLPSDSNNSITFGCLNAFAKTNSQVHRLWKTILDTVPKARLLLHAPRGKARDLGIEHFGSRVEFVSRVPQTDYFSLHSKIDIGLDPFPYPGGTTTCDALWMGVPVVTLSGNLPMARAGSSILHNANLPELIAQSEEQYLQIATTLANDRHRLRELRATLRDRLRAAPLMDEVGFTRGFESALRRIWTAWCDATANRT